MSPLRCALVALCLLVPLAAPAQDYAALEKIYFDDHLEAHDLEAHAAGLLNAVAAAPGKPESWIALQRLAELRRTLATQKPMYQLLGQLAARDFADCGVYADSYAELYLDLARDFETDPAWHRLAQRWGGLVGASWIGPFAESGPSAHDDLFSPELAADFSRRAAGPWGQVQWRPVARKTSLHGEIDLGAEHRWQGSGYYVAFSLVSGSARDVVVKPRFSGPGKVWLNGALLADIDARARDQARPWLTCTLQRGRNLLLVKLSSMSPLTVRLRTPGGSVPDGIVCEAPGAATPVVAALPGPPAHPRWDVPELQQLGPDAPSTPRQRAALHLARAAGFAAHGLREAWAEEYDLALQAAPKEPLVRLAWLVALEESPLVSGGERRRLTRSGLDALLADHPGLVPALLLQASNLGRDERWQEAHECIAAARKSAPASWRVTLSEIDLYARADWRPLWQACLQRAQAQAPDAMPVLAASSRFWSRRSLPGAQLESDRRMLALMPSHRDVAAAMITALLRIARPEEALKLARQQAAQDPYSDFLQSRLAIALAAAGKLVEACEVHELLAARSSHPEYAWQDAARLCLQHGDTGRAQGYLARALEASPGQHAARRQLQRLRGEAEDFWSPHALPLAEAMQHDVTPEAFPRADSALVLDEMIHQVFADGSSRSFVHQVRKVLTQDGVDQRGKEDINGEIVLARTIRPDGTVLEPITYSGNRLEFPGVAIGCYIEFAWLNHTEGNAWGTLMGDRFFFSDQNGQEPFAISRYVLLAPAAMALGMHARNMQPGDHTVQAEGDQVVHTWDVRRPDHPLQEDFGPPALETIPWLEITQARDWRRKARETADRGLALGRRTSSLVARHAAEICGDAATDEQKARCIYAWVNEKITTRGDSYSPHQTLRNMAGRRDELFVALCQAAGVQLGFAAADYAPVYKTDVTDDLPSPSWAHVRDEDFGLFLAVVRGDDGAWLFLDLADRLRPFGELSARRSGAPVIVWQAGRSQLARLPVFRPDSDRFENRLVLRLAADGSAEVEGSVSIFGDRAWGLKESLRTQPADDMQNRLEGELAGVLQGLDLHEFSAPGLDRPGTPLVRSFKGKVETLARMAESTMSLNLPMESLGQLLSALAATPERRRAVVMNFDLHQSDEVRILPPQGWRFAELPQALVYPTAPLLYELQFELVDGELVIRRSLALGPGRIEPALYPQLVQQVKQITQAEEARVMLVKR